MSYFFQPLALHGLGSSSPHLIHHIFGKQELWQIMAEEINKLECSFAILVVSGV
jgi:hypothetical protein